jgi:CRISPR-associated protein Csh1
MVEAMIELGRMLREKIPEPLVENPNTNGKYNYVILLKTERDGKALNWNGTLVVQEFDDDKIPLYMYRKGPASGCDFSPTSKLVDPNKAKESVDKLLTRLSRAILSAGLEPDNLQDARKEIIEKLESLDLPRGESVIVSLLVDNEYVGKVEEFRSNFREDLLKSLSANSPSEQEICFLCGEKASLYGNLSKVLGFYTVDKHGFVAGGFKPWESWKNFAACENCVLDLERAKRFIEGNLTFRFYRKSFWLIPRTVFVEDRKAIIELTARLQKDIKDLGKQEKAKQERIEMRMLDIASRAKNIALYEIVFLRKISAAVRIILHLEEVIPTRIKEFLRIREDTELSVGYVIEPNDPKTAWKSGAHFRFFSGVLGDSEEFYNLVDKVFRKQPVELSPLLRMSMNGIRKYLANQNKLPTYEINEVFTSLLFLKRWETLKSEGGKSMAENPFDDFFSRYEEFFDHPAKRGLFLLGVMIQKLLRIQVARGHNRPPFLKSLKNLRITQKDAENLLPKIQNKLSEYEAGHWYSDIREGMSIYLIQAGSEWGFPPDEIGFYTVLGMNLANRGPFKKKEDESNERDNKEPL